MKKQYYILLIYALTICFLYPVTNIEAQKLYDGVQLNINKFQKQGDLMILDIDFILDQLALKSRSELILRPVLKNNNQQFDSRPVVIKGKINNKVYLRHKAFHKNVDIYTDALVVARKKGTQAVNYVVTIPYQSWMNQADVFLQTSSCPGCGLSKTSIEEYALTNILQKSTVEKDIHQPLISFVVPPKGEQREIHQNESAYLKFVPSSVRIDPSFKDNKVELGKIDAVMGKLVDDRHVAISDVTIEGFASIEGTYDINMRLSKGRAEAFQSYLQEKYHLNPSILKVKWLGEDWDGLIKLIEKGDMKQKEKVLHIINTINIFDGREKQLMLLDKGDPYRYMFNTYFPLLRKVDYSIHYSVNELSLQESRNTLHSQPEKLSMRELFLLAQQNDKDSDQFEKIMEQSLSLYPNDNIARVNMAATYILRGKYDQAQYYLDLAENSAEVLNNRGVIYMMKGNPLEAKDLFIKADLLGSTDAKENIKILEKITRGQ